MPCPLAHLPLCKPVLWRWTVATVLWLGRGAGCLPSGRALCAGGIGKREEGGVSLLCTSPPPYPSWRTFEKPAFYKLHLFPNSKLHRKRMACLLVCPQMRPQTTCWELHLGLNHGHLQPLVRSRIRSGTAGTGASIHRGPCPFSLA